RGFGRVRWPVASRGGTGGWELVAARPLLFGGRGGSSNPGFWVVAYAERRSCAGSGWKVRGVTQVQGSVRSLAVAVADAVSEAMAAALPGDVAGADPLVRRSDHADFQSNVALSLAKKLGRPPREVAGSITEKLR